MAVAPKIDGVIQADEWSAAAQQTGGFDENTGAPDPNPATYYLGYDAKFIYFAAKIRDPQPTLIRATETRSNVSVSGDDNMVFAIDPFGTLSDTNEFQVNPNGATNLRIAGGRAAKREWLGEIQAKGRITADGWEVEARVPWSVLRLPGAGKRDLRVSFGHVVARTGRNYSIDDLSSNQSSKNFGIWSAVEVPKVALDRALKLLPYTYGGVDRDGIVANAGLDFKIPATSEIDLVGSINPDFRNIENQVLSIDFSYFERLAGESRPFFLEGNQYFQTSGDAPLFVSQRIDGFDLGTKIYGKLGERGTLGFLNTIDFGNEVNTVGSYNYSIDSRTSAGVAIANQQLSGNSNTGTFLRFNHDLGPYSFFAQHMTTSDDSEGSGHRYNTGVVYNGTSMFGILEYVEISPHFLPRLGFAPERDFRAVNTYLNFFKPVKFGPVTEAGLNAGYFDSRTFENTPYRKTLDLGGYIVIKDTTLVNADFNYQEFEGFKDSVFSFYLSRPRGDPYRHVQLNTVFGNIAGHSYRSIAPSVAYRPVKNLQLLLSYQLVDHFDTEDQTIFSANYDLNQSDAIGGRFVKRNSDMNFYIAFRRAGNRGNEYFLILGDPNALTFRPSLILKATFPLQLKF